MPATYLLRNQLLPTEAIKLGRFIVDMENVLNGTHDSSDAPQTPIPHQLDNINDLALTSRKPKLSAQLQSLMSTLLTSETTTAHNMTTIKAMTYTLENSNEWFAKVIDGQEATRRWLETQDLDGEDVFLITGFATIQDASLATSKFSNQKADLSLGKASVAAAQLTAQDQQVANAVTFQAPGEKVYAVQYRKVNMTRWPKKDIAKAKLKKGVTWKVYFGGTRGEEVEEAEEYDTISAQLEEGKSEGEGGEEDENQEVLVIDGVEFRIR